MTRLHHLFGSRPVFMPYFPLGYPDLRTSIDIITALAKHGADVIELGIPFSDPLADGPVIQNATQIALRNGMNVRKSLVALRELRERGLTIPLIMMSYYNPLLAFGLQALACELKRAGADGLIVPDLPVEESGPAESILEDMPLIRMLAPTTPDERIEFITRRARGFIYLVSVTGTTGARRSLAGDLADLIARVRAHTNLPVCVGFGIGTPAQARAVGALADGVIVGSACVSAIGRSSNPISAAVELARSYKEALAMRI